MENYYSVLEVNEDASFDEIKEAYRALVQMCHPDHNAGNKFAAEKFKRIQTAYEVLSDPQKREEYDMEFLQMQTENSQMDYDSYYDGYMAAQEEMMHQMQDVRLQQEQENQSQSKKKKIGSSILAGAAIVAGIAGVAADASASIDKHYADCLSKNLGSSNHNVVGGWNLSEELAVKSAYSSARNASVVSSVTKGLAGILGGLAVSKFLKDK